MGTGLGLSHEHNIRRLALRVHPNLSFLLQLLVSRLSHDLSKASAKEAVGVGAAGFIFGLHVVVLVICSLRKEESNDGFLGSLPVTK